MLGRWSIFDARFGDKVRGSDAAWARSLSVEDRLAIVEDLYDTVRRARERAADWRTVEELAWQQTLAERRRLVVRLLASREHASSQEVASGRTPVADAG